MKNHYEITYHTFKSLPDTFAQYDFPECGVGKAVYQRFSPVPHAEVLLQRAVAYHDHRRGPAGISASVQLLEAEDVNHNHRESEMDSRGDFHEEGMGSAQCLSLLCRHPCKLLHLRREAKLLADPLDRFDTADLFGTFRDAYLG